MKKKKVALLDLGGVVFQSSGKSNESIKWDIISKLNEKYWKKLELGENAFPDFILDYNILTSQELSGEEFLKKVFDTLDFNTELIDFIRKERDIIIVSDNYIENIEYISKRYDFDSWAVKQIYSFTYKMHKSNPDFFKRLLEDISEYDIDELIFIDDSVSKLDSASKSGIIGFLFQNNEQIIKELSNYS